MSGGYAYDDLYSEVPRFPAHFCPLLEPMAHRCIDPLSGRRRETADMGLNSRALLTRRQRCRRQCCGGTWASPLSPCITARTCGPTACRSTPSATCSGSVCLCLSAHGWRCIISVCRRPCASVGVTVCVCATGCVWLRLRLRLCSWYVFVSVVLLHVCGCVHCGCVVLALVSYMRPRRVGPHKRSALRTKTKQPKFATNQPPLTVHQQEQLSH